MAKVNWQCPNEWSEWVDWLAAGLHARNRWRLPVLMVGMLFANGRRTVTTWLRAAGVSDDYQDYYYALAAFGRKTSSIAERLIILILRTLPLPERLLLVIDDSPTKRYGPKVEGADVHHNPTPGPADQPYLFGHVWVTESLALRHPRWGPIGLPLRAMLYVRKRTMETIPRKRHWYRFATKLQLAARLVEWAAPLLKNAGKNGVGRHRRRVYQSALPPACLADSETGCRWSPAQRRRLARLAADEEAGAKARARPTSQIREKDDQPRQAGRVRSGAGKPSNARSMGKPSRRRTKHSWRPIPRSEA